MATNFGAKYNKSYIKNTPIDSKFRNLGEYFYGLGGKERRPLFEEWFKRVILEDREVFARALVLGFQYLNYFSGEHQLKLEMSTAIIKGLVKQRYENKPWSFSNFNDNYLYKNLHKLLSDKEIMFELINSNKFKITHFLEWSHTNKDLQNFMSPSCKLEHDLDFTINEILISKLKDHTLNPNENDHIFYRLWRNISERSKNTFTSDVVEDAILLINKFPNSSAHALHNICSKTPMSQDILNVVKSFSFSKCTPDNVYYSFCNIHRLYPHNWDLLKSVFPEYAAIIEQYPDNDYVAAKLGVHSIKSLQSKERKLTNFLTESSPSLT